MELLRKNKTTILLVLILLVAAFLRLYRIGDYLTFLGDEGRDVLIVRHILEGQFTLLGPRASAGDFFTGPIYYYMMAPFLWLWHYDPTGPAVMIALLGIATVYLIYRFGREWFGEHAALIAASLYAVSPLVLEYSRSSWNPNPMPFFTLLILYCLYKGVQQKSFKLFLLSGFLYGIGFQLHYIMLAVSPVILFFVGVGTYIKRGKEIVAILFKRYLIMLGGFLIGMAPFLAFEARHGFPNTRAIITFLLFGDPKATDIIQTPFFIKIYEVFFRLFGRLLIDYPPDLGLKHYTLPQLITWQVLAVGIGIISIVFLLKLKNMLTKLLFGLWVLFGVGLFIIYKKPIYDYYFEFMFPLPFLLFGNMLSQITDYKPIKKWGGVLAAVVTIFLIVWNLLDNPFKFPPNRQKQQVENIDTFVLSKTDNKPFNFALLTPGNSDHAYRYYFEIYHRKPVVIDNTLTDPERKTVTNQLMVVCEDLNCKPLGNSLFEIAGFGRAQIAGVWDYSVVKVYKLVHYKAP